MYVALVAIVVVLLWFVGIRIGLLRPRLSSIQVGYTQNTSTKIASMSFEVINSGHFATTMTGIDGSAPGMGKPSVVVSQYDTERILTLPVSISPGSGVMVRLRYGSIDCHMIMPLGSTTILVHARTIMGINTTSSVSPGLFNASTIPGHSVFDPGEVLSWSAGITSHICVGDS